ncbi:MAG: GNAT family N-acetyltransferase [Pseudomonadota bacterium]
MRTFGREHLPGALRLSQREKWPHREEDWALTLSQSRGVVALSDNRVVGTALASDFGPVWTMSMIIVDQDARGRGLGKRLMETVMPFAGSREMRLTATEDGLPLYEKLGFVPVGEITQLQGQIMASVPDVAVAVQDSDIAECIELDKAASGMHRDDLLRRIAAKGLVLRADRGFAILRDFGRGKLLGPIVAKDIKTARALLADAATRCDGQFLRIDTDAFDLADFACILGLSPVGRGVSMTKNANTAGATSAFRTFGLMSQALG